MKVKLIKEDLLNSLQTVSNIVSSKVSLPILSNILLETKKNTLKLNATDLDIGICCEIPVEILEEGGITIPAKRFNDIIREMPEGIIYINSKKNNQIDIEGVNCRFKLNGLPKEEFPKFPDFNNKEVIRIEQKLLKDMLRLTSFAVSHEESRFVLNGILIEIENEHIKIIATDGRRLAKIEKKLLNPIKKENHVIIPSKAVNEINRNLKDEGKVTLIFGSNQILFDIEGIFIATRVIEGDFPNYNQVIPKLSAKKVSVNTKELLATIRRANLLSTPDFQAIKFEIFAEKMVVSKNTPDVGESREEINIEYGGAEMVVGFNPQFLIDVLKQIDDENINIEFLGVDKPAVIRNNDYLYLALPMRI